MRYGINFGAPAIPDVLRRKFPVMIPISSSTRVSAVLVGMTDSPIERDDMLVVATNGHRRIHVESRVINRRVWFGIYSY